MKQVLERKEETQSRAWVTKIFCKWATLYKIRNQVGHHNILCGNIYKLLCLCKAIAHCKISLIMHIKIYCAYKKFLFTYIFMLGGPSPKSKRATFSSRTWRGLALV